MQDIMRGRRTHGNVFLKRPLGLQYTNQASMRNIFILGFSLYNGLSITQYFASFTETEGHGPIATGSTVFNGARLCPAYDSTHCCMYVDAPSI